MYEKQKTITDQCRRKDRHMKYWLIWDYFNDKSQYLKTQIGNPDGEDVPNKKHYDPRKWIREAELTFKDRLKQAFKDLNNINTLWVNKPKTLGLKESLKAL